MTDQAERYGWNKASIKMAADIAREKGVIVRLERDGTITILPVENAPPGIIEKNPDMAGW